MIWNIRVVKHIDEGETILQLAEVFYNEVGKPCGWVSVNSFGESIDELHQYTDWMKEALAYPILEFDNDFGNWDTVA
jgi:hypothetical protein